MESDERHDTAIVQHLYAVDRNLPSFVTILLLIASGMAIGGAVGYLFGAAWTVGTVFGAFAPVVALWLADPHGNRGDVA